MPNPWSSPSAWHFLACTSTFASFRNLASGPQPSTLLSCVTLINLMIHFDIWLILVIPKGCITACLIITLIIFAPFSAFQPSTLLPPDPDSFLGDDSLMRMLPWHWPPAWFLHEAQASTDSDFASSFWSKILNLYPDHSNCEVTTGFAIVSFAVFINYSDLTIS